MPFNIWHIFCRCLCMKFKQIYIYFNLMRAFATIALVIALSGAVHAHGVFDMEEDVLRKEVHSMNTIVEPVFNSTVHQYIKYYMKDADVYSHSMLERSAIYFPFIEKALHQAGLPLELKYLVVIESSVQPSIRSRVGACGLWQLMIPTARYCGLTINHSIDERMDPQRSTEAAIIYLQELYDQFSDWSLVMAAYNCGPSRVRKAMQLAGTDDYWKVAKYLPRETRKYVPKFIAAQYSFDKSLRERLFTMDVSLDLLYTTEVRLTAPTSLSEVAEVTGISEEVIRSLNTAWKRNKIGDSNGNYSLRIPARVVNKWLAYDQDRATQPMAEAGFHNTYYENSYRKLEYPLQKGETIQTIADLFGISPYLINWWNDILPNEEVEKGQSLTIYIPHNHSCSYIGEALMDAKNLRSISFPGFKPIVSRNNVPLEADILQIAIQAYKREDNPPVIIPRGMSYAQYMNKRQ